METYLILSKGSPVRHHLRLKVGHVHLKNDTLEAKQLAGAVLIDFMPYPRLVLIAHRAEIIAFILPVVTVTVLYFFYIRLCRSGK